MNGLRWFGRLFGCESHFQTRTLCTDRNRIYLQVESLEPRCVPTLAITTTTLVNSDVGLPYSQTINTTGGVGSVIFSSIGALPTGLTLSTNGVLAGIPTVTGSYSFTVTANDATGANANELYTVVVAHPITFAATTIRTVTLASFNGFDGSIPECVLEDSNGNLFGTTRGGGSFAYGTVFEVPHGSSAIVTLASFNGTNGAYPNKGMVEDSSGNLFGTTENGGLGLFGTVFELPRGSGTITTIAKFRGSNGANPVSGLVEDSSGNLFGVTKCGGPGSITAYTGYGTLFEIPEGGALTTLATFSGPTGTLPEGGLFEDSSGDLFGTTNQGGASFVGTVFEYKPGSSSITALASFTFNTANQTSSGVLQDANGNLFGESENLEGPGYGAIFELPRGGNTITDLAVFNGSSGKYPSGGLILDADGNLFGTTTSGGTMNYGTAFELKAGSSTISTLVSFNGTNGDSTGDGLIMDSNGNLFGTSAGGTYGVGVVFEITNGLADWTVNQPSYNQTIGFSGGTGARTISTTGTLPPGLVLSSAGVLSGIPTKAGSFSFTVVITDALGASARKSFLVVVNPSVAITTAVLGNGSAGSGYRQVLSTSGGTGPFTFILSAGRLPPGLTLTTTGSLTGEPTTVGNYLFTVMVTDTTGANARQSYTVTISPGLLANYIVAALGASAIQAGSGLLVSVQAADAYGNALTNYSGPGSVTVSTIPATTGGGFPVSVPLNSNGSGFFLVKLQKVGMYTISVTGGGFYGSSSAVTVTPGPAVQLGFTAKPADTPTGDVVPPVTVQVQDLYGNVVASDNSDLVSLNVVGGPGSFRAGSTTTAPVVNGVATFNNLTLAVPGSYTLSELVPGRYTGPNSAAFTVTPLQVLPGSIVGTPSGFSLQFNAPFLVNSVTPVLFGQGFGATALVPSVTLTQTINGSGHAVNVPIAGSLVLNTAINSITFVATDTTLQANYGSPVLPDGTYTGTVHSSPSTNGFQAQGSGGGFLDGLGSGTAGSGDYTAKFTVNAAAAHDDLLWAPATADGPGQALSAPGRNQVGGGYPIYLNDTTGAVTNVQATLNYDPALLTVTGVSGANFSLVGSSTPGHAVLQYSGPALPAGNQTPIGFVTATVPSGTAGNPTPYKAKDLLHLSGVSLNSGAVPVATADALHLLAYVGDANGDGTYSSDDAVRITRVSLQTDTGFSAYPLVDPVIVADTDGSGFIPADAALQANEAGVGFPTANLSVPPIPPGVVFTPGPALVVSGSGVHRPMVQADVETARQRAADQLFAALGHIDLQEGTGLLNWDELGTDLGSFVRRRRSETVS